MRTWDLTLCRIENMLPLRYAGTVVLLRDKIKGTVHTPLYDSTLEFTRGRRAEGQSEPRYRQKASWHLHICDTMQLQVNVLATDFFSSNFSTPCI